MDLLVWHGYLLAGTGSNIHIQNISREFCQLGHNVHLFIQESDLDEYDFISRKYTFEDDNSKLALEWERETEYLGKCFAYQPSIKELLPVFVYDNYEGFTVKTFLDLSDEELEIYKQQNIKAIDLVMNKATIDAFIADHGVISPLLAKETCLKRSTPYIVLIQGSDIEFTIKKSQRYLDLSYEGIKTASSVIAVTDHIKRELSKVYNGSIDHIVKVVPSGVDLNTFIPTSDKKLSLQSFIAASKNLQDKRGNGFSKKKQGRTLSELKTNEIDDELIGNIHNSYNDRAPDVDVEEKLSCLSSNSKLVTFVGKLMVTKGAHLAIAAMGKVFGSDPSLKLVIIGFGPLREHLELLVDSIALRDIDRLFLIAKMIDDKLDTRDYLSEFYRDLKDQGKMDDYFDMSAGIKEKVIFTGLLYHDQIKHMLAITDIQLTLSIFPEAFGLVILEGTASGAIPIVSNHSGLRDVLISLEEKGGLDNDFFRLTLSKDALIHLSELVERILGLDDDSRKQLKKTFSKTTNLEYGWSSVSKRFTEHINEILIEEKN